MVDHVHVGASQEMECCDLITEAPALSEGAAEDLAHVYAALADPVRLRLLSLVAAHGELCSCDLVEPLGKSQPTVSHHTKVLAEAGLIEGDKRGRWVHWRIADGRHELVRSIMALAPATA
ncbi:MAG: ArsR/SmtB family transcription factor [Acidimicrobiia bacterium]